MAPTERDRQRDPQRPAQPLDPAAEDAAVEPQLAHLRRDARREPLPRRLEVQLELVAFPGDLEAPEQRGAAAELPVGDQLDHVEVDPAA